MTESEQIYAPPVDVPSPPPEQPGVPDDVQTGFGLEEGSASTTDPEWKEQGPLGGSVPQDVAPVIGGDQAEVAAPQEG